MRQKILGFKEEGAVAVVEMTTSIDSPDKLIRLSREISDCCEKFRMNDGNLVLAIIERTPGLLALEQQSGFTAMGFPASVSLAQSIADCERPVMIGIRGNAVGLGLELALACDIRIASETSRFGLPQIGEGLMPCDGGTQRLCRTVGKAKALEMILTGELIDAREANRIGLVSRIVPAEQVLPTVMRLARDMASKSPISLEYCKESIMKGMDLTLEQGIRLEADLYFLLHTTHDRREGIKAFQEKRKPEFKGN
jgi:enoyl-CoA hydratase/carnithine racemase